MLSRISAGSRRPEAVLCGSTNFTHSGVYRQANVVHTVKREDVAWQYLDLFEELFRGADVRSTRAFVDQNNALDPPRPLSVGFSPRSGLTDLEAFVGKVDAARRDVLFCTAFGLYKGIEDALLGEPHYSILRYGVQNNRSYITGYHRDRTAHFVAAAMLSEGLQGFLEESTAGQLGRMLIHTKLIVVDFTSDALIVISGSHNFSEAASKGNDENYLILRGDTDVADCYGCELMRLYDHYRFRWYRKQAEDADPPVLAEDDGWTDEYFEPDSLKESDRLRFAGSVA